jgi:hypothetical protein
MSDSRRAARDLEITAAADRGVRYATLARQYRLSERQIGNIVREKRAERVEELASLATMDHVNETLAQYESAIEELALTAAAIPADSWSHRVGAVKAKVEVVKARWELLQAIGYVPQNLSTVRVELEAAEVGRAIVGVLEAYGVDEVVQDAILDVVEGREVELPALPAGGAG